MEQNFLIFLFSAVIISLSGVLSPGPMTAAVIEQGGRMRFPGLYVSIGHGAVEIPLMVFIFLGAGSLLELQWVRIVVGMAGGIYLILLGKNMLKGNGHKAREKHTASSLLSGVVLSIGNPYFLLWWATVGAGLVIAASGFGLKGLVSFAVVHWLCDVVWLSFLSFASFKGIKTFGAGLYRKVSVFCGAAMLFYGGVFIVGAARLLVGTG